MLYIFRGPTPLNLIAGDIQTAIHAQVAPCEHAPSVQHRQDGCYDLQFREETLTEIHNRLSKENGISVAVVQDMLTRDVAGFDATPKQVVTGETRRSGTHSVFISPNLVKDDGTQVTLADFPDGFGFGNGVTCNTPITFRDGSVRIVSWASFPASSEAAAAARRATLQQLVEG